MDIVLKTALNGKKNKKGLYEIGNKKDEQIANTPLEHVTSEIDHEVPTIEQ